MKDINLPPAILAYSTYRKLFSKKANSKKIIVETFVNQAKYSLIGYFILTNDMEWEFYHVDEDISSLKNVSEILQVGELY